MIDRLIVYQIKVTRDYEDSPDYMIFESGNFSRPLLILSEIEARRLRDDLDSALAMKVARSRTNAEGK